MMSVSIWPAGVERHHAAQERGVGLKPNIDEHAFDRRGRAPSRDVRSRSRTPDTLSSPKISSTAVDGNDLDLAIGGGAIDQHALRVERRARDG